jgi:hypothetical protein
MRDIEIELQFARIDIHISIVRLLFRSKAKSLSNEKKETILTEAKNLKRALEVLKITCTANEEMYSINADLYLENLKLKKELIKQQEDENMQEL